MNPSAAPIDFSPPVRWLLARTAVALTVIAATGGFGRTVTAAGLVACVWLDAFAGRCARRRGWEKTRFATACEMLADFVCFVWAPVAWVTAADGSAATRLAGGVFVLAGVFRLARFQAEGLVRGGYRGLPVTYNGYLIPAAGVLVATVLPYPAWVWPAVFAGLAAAMASTRFVVPEF